MAENRELPTQYGGTRQLPIKAYKTVKTGKPALMIYGFCRNHVDRNILLYNQNTSSKLSTLKR